MAVATTTLREQLAADYAARAVYLSLHNGDPGSTGANEVPTTGGSPNYARKAPVWAAGSTTDGAQSAAAVQFDVPPPSSGTRTITHVGVWSAVTGGTFLDSYALPATAAFTGQGQLLVTPTVTVV